MNYSNTIIYKIVCKDNSILDCYVGHTTNLHNRIKTHKSSCNNLKSSQHNNKVYICIRENGGWDNWNFIELEKINCKDIKEAALYEQKWYDLLNPSLNFQRPGQTEKERNYNYYHLHTEKIKENKKITSQIRYSCECGGFYTTHHRTRHLKSQLCFNYFNNNL